MTTFKIGDMARLTGSGWPRYGLPVGSILPIEDIKEGHAVVHGANGDELFITDNVHWSAEPAPPPPATRKRLREYTDLCDGDVAVIAGVPFTVDGDALIADEKYIWTTQMPWAAMLVDEVRRKPRKRRVLEEIDAKDVRAGDIIVYEDGRMVLDAEVGRSMYRVATVYRLVEETEVPR